MQSLADCYYLLANNPFVAAPVIAGFYISLEKVDQNLLLAPIVLPLSTHPEHSTNLFNAKLTGKNPSSIYTLFNKEKKNLFDLQEWVDEFRGLTYSALQHAYNNGWIVIDSEKFNVSKGYEPLPQNSINSKQYKSAVKLAHIVGNLSSFEIYNYLGVRLV